MKSIFKELGTVSFPQHTMERVYMKEFRKEKGLPNELKRWQGTIDQMLLEVDSDGPIYLMIDQGLVKANTTHRRSGVRIDGYWIPELQTHGPRPGAHIFAKNKGYWDGEIKEGGDCSHLNLSHLERVALQANKVYAGNVTMLHESTPVMEDVLRTLVRLSVPGWSPSNL